MRRIIFLLFFACYVVELCADNADSISVYLHEETNDEYIFCISNKSCDTIYLFDGYLGMCSDGYIYSSKYFYRYDKRNKSYKLSLLPLLPELRLRGCVNNVITYYKDRIIQNGRLTFTFTNVAPGDSLMVPIKKDAFKSSVCIKDFYAEKLSCFHHVLMLPKMKERKIKRKPKGVIMEFGVYEKVAKLLEFCGNVSYDDVESQAKSMIVLSVPVGVR